MSEKTKRIRNVIAVATALGTAGTFAAFRGGPDKQPTERRVAVTTSVPAEKLTTTSTASVPETTLPPRHTTTTAISKTTITTQKPEAIKANPNKAEALLEKTSVQLVLVDAASGQRRNWCGGAIGTYNGQPLLLSAEHCEVNLSEKKVEIDDLRGNKLGEVTEYVDAKSNDPNDLSVARITGNFSNLEPLTFATPHKGETLYAMTGAESEGFRHNVISMTYQGDAHDGNEGYPVYVSTLANGANYQDVSGGTSGYISRNSNGDIVGAIHGGAKNEPSTATQESYSDSLKRQAGMQPGDQSDVCTVAPALQSDLNTRLS